MRVSAQKLDRILVVNVNWLGDVVFSIPVFKALRQNYPQAHICCLALPRVVEILQCVPQIDQIIIYDEKGKNRGLWGKLCVLREIRRQHFDAVFLLHGSWSRALLMRLAGVPIRVGYAGKQKEKILTDVIPILTEEHHKSDVYLNVIESFGIKVLDRTATLAVPAQASVGIDKILLGKGLSIDEPFVVVHTSGNWDLKRWPQKNWAQLIKILRVDLKLNVVISEGPKEARWAEEIACLSGVNPVVLAGETTLHELMALLQRALIVISADSGPLHIASCVTKNIIGLYGPTTPLTTGPRGLADAQIFYHDVGCNRAPCYYLACPDNVCMKSVTVEMVVKSVERLLGNQNARQK